MNTTVIHHSADYDGIFCREIARKFLPDAKLVVWDYADAPLEIPTGQVYVLDLPVDRVFGFKYATTDVDGKPPQQPGGLVWIDHHKSSIDTHPTAIPGYRIDGVAACRLAWQWFAGEPPNFANRGGDQRTMPSKEDFVERRVAEPLAVRLAGEYDIWDKRDERADIFQYGLRARELTDFDWRDMLSTRKATIEEIESLISVGHQNILNPDGTHVPATVCQLLESGKVLKSYSERTDASMMKRSFLIEFEGLKFLALTTARCNSLTFAAKDVPETGHDALMGFYFNGKSWTVSLYHAKHRMDVDLSQIAVKHGGGGHRGACGFVANKLPFLP